MVQPALGRYLSWQPRNRPTYTMCAVSLRIHVSISILVNRPVRTQFFFVIV